MLPFDRFKNKVLPEAISFGSFGKDVNLISVTEDKEKGKDQFASTVQFVDIKLSVGGVVKQYAIVCKFQPDNAEKRDRFQTASQFFNEVLVYKEIVPLFPECTVHLLPKFYYGVATLDSSPEDDVVIVDNLIPKDYKQTRERVFLDYDHCLLVFKRLGELHGASLHVKTTNSLKFASKINQLAETRWIPRFKEYQNYYYRENAKRGVIPLIKDGEHLDILNRFLNRLENVHDIIKEVLSVNENSILCHGDFCRNNMVFKYDDGRPVDVKFYDLATARYASPAIDISFFVFLNISSELRHRHIQEFLKVYRDAVLEVAGSTAFSADVLWKEFQQKAVYGYLLTAFFLPMMLNDQPGDLDHLIRTLTVEERVKLNLLRGGQKVTDILTQSVRDLISWGCLT